MPTKAIYVTQGKKRYVGGTITERFGKDISGATYTVAIGTSTDVPPTAGWAAPTVNTAGTSPSSRVLKVLIEATTQYAGAPIVPGRYTIWGNITDNPEIEPIYLQRFDVA